MRHELKPASQTPASAGSCGPEKKTSAGEGGSGRFITPDGGMSGCRAFHSSEKTTPDAKSMRQAAHRRLARKGREWFISTCSSWLNDVANTWCDSGSKIGGW